MSKQYFALTFATLLITVLVAPATFFIMPERASAQGGGVFSCAGTAIGALSGGLFSLFGGISGLAVPTAPGDSGINGTGAGAGIDSCLNGIAKSVGRMMIKALLQQITGSIIAAITGRAQPSFVLNLSVHLQAVGDSVALPFISQIQRVMNPAFAGAIGSSLLMKYAQGSSVGGFLASSQSTLGAYTPNQGAFLAGNYSQGGIPAWFALTTQSNNNPYMLEPAAQGKLNSLLNQAKTNRRQDLVQGRGFLSWCGESTAGSGSSIAPTASCTEGGKEGTVQTPGTVIQGYADKALGAQIAELINPGDIDSAIAQIFQTALQTGISSLAGNVFGPGGLFGANTSSAVAPRSPVFQQQVTSANNWNTTISANSAAQSKLRQVSDYTTAWNTIGTAAADAKGIVSQLKNTCASQVGAADTALGQIESVIAQAQAGITSVSDTQTFAQKVQQDTTTNASTLAADTQTLATMPPTAAEVISAEREARVTNAATASPDGSLTVSGGTLVDQMNLISGNAQVLSANCLP